MTIAPGHPLHGRLTEARAYVAHLTSNLPEAVDPLALPKTTLQAPYIALCIREAQTWRAEEFARAACDMFERGDWVVGVSNTRAVIESVATIWFLKCLIEAEIARKAAASDTHGRLMKLYLGSKSNPDLPEAVNVLKMLDKIDKDIPGVRAKYDRMSEFAHPNYDGAAGSFGVPDRDTLITHFGRRLRENDYPAELGLDCIVASADTLFVCYNRIGDLIGQFTAACEKGFAEAPG